MNIEDLLKDKIKAKKVLEKALVDGNKDLVKALIPIVKDPELTYFYAKDIVKGKIKDEFEDIIATSDRYSYFYAKNVLRSPFPKGEDNIALTLYSYFYAKYVLNSPFPKGEDAIARDNYYSYDYAKDILKDRFIKGEKSIIDSCWVYDYVDFLKKINKLNEFLKDHPEVKDKIKK